MMIRPPDHHSTLLNDVFLPFHISRHLYLTNLIIPSLENRIIIYAQSFVVTSEIGLTKQKQDIEIYLQDMNLS